MGWGSRRQPFLGKHVIITGGSAGIGLALAKEFYKQGACLTLIARTKAKLEAAVAEIEQLRQSGPGKGTVAPQPAQRVEFQTADTTVPEQVRRPVHSTTRLYSHNTGLPPRGKPANTERPLSSLAG